MLHTSMLPRRLLRVSLGYLMTIWGVDKLVNPAHGLVVLLVEDAPDPGGQARAA